MLHERTVEKLVELVALRWNKFHLPLFFSQVPDSLMKIGIDIQDELHGEKLSSGIRAIDPQKVRIVKNPKDEKIFALVPSDVDDSENKIFSRQHAKTSQEPYSGHTRYKNIVWSAFSSPLPTGKRFLILENGLFFEDQGIDATTPTGGVRVPNEYIQKHEEKLPGYEIARRIERWANMNNVPRESIVFAESGRRSLTHFGKFAELDEEDQKRIMIPLDIVMKVIR